MFKSFIVAAATIMCAQFAFANSADVIAELTSVPGYGGGSRSGSGYKADFFKDEPASKQQMFANPNAKGDLWEGNWNNMVVEFRTEDGLLTYNYTRSLLSGNKMETDYLRCNWDKPGMSIDRHVVFNEPGQIAAMKASSKFSQLQKSVAEAKLANPAGFAAVIIGKRCISLDGGNTFVAFAGNKPDNTLVIPVIRVDAENGKLAMQAVLGSHPDYGANIGRSTYKMTEISSQSRFDGFVDAIAKGNGL